MNHLTVLYDAHCGLCRRARAWLEAQPQLVPLAFVAAGSSEAGRRFPDLDLAATLRDLHVVGDGGEVYRGTSAWLMCLWALHEHRGWALTFAHPWTKPLFAAGVALIQRLRTTSTCAGGCGVAHAAVDPPRPQAAERPPTPAAPARPRGGFARTMAEVTAVLFFAPLAALVALVAAGAALSALAAMIAG